MVDDIATAILIAVLTGIPAWLWWSNRKRCGHWLYRSHESHGELLQVCMRCKAVRVTRVDSEHGGWSSMETTLADWTQPDQNLQHRLRYADPPVAL